MASEGSPRTSSPVMLFDSERQLFQKYANTKGWSMGKLVRIATKAFIYLELKNVRTFDEAMEKAIMNDVDNRERMS